MIQSKQSRRTPAWEKNLRQLIRTDHGSGWSVRPIRSRTQITRRWADGTRSSIVSGIPWAGTEASRILALVGRLGELIEQQHLTIAEAHEQLTGGTSSSNPEEVLWPVAIDRFKGHKLSSGAVKITTWNMLYRPAMALVGDAMERKPAPRSGRALLEALVKIGGGAPGSAGRRKRLQIAAQLLRYTVERCGAAARWAPPESIADLIGKKLTHRESTAPLLDNQLLELLAGIEDPRWRLALGLMGCFGLRPIEAWHCKTQQGRLKVDYRKRTSAGPGKPRVVVGLDPAGAPGLAADLLSQLEERGAAGLPPLPPSQQRAPSRAVWEFLLRLPVWKELQGGTDGQLVPYSCRHGYALRAHQRYELSVRVAASLMGHTTSVHLSHYGTWADADTIEEAINRARARLEAEGPGVATAAG